MSIKEAKKMLKKHSEVVFYNFYIYETTELINNWYEYTGKYRVIDGSGFEIFDSAVSMTEVFKRIQKIRKGE